MAVPAGCGHSSALTATPDAAVRRPVMPPMVKLAATWASSGSPTVRDYGVIVLDSDETPIDRPCEDCGGLVVSGLEPFAPGDDPELEAEGLTAAKSEWCTNLDCPSNHVLRGLTRVGVNDYICTTCGEALRTPMSAVRAHRATH